MHHVSYFLWFKISICNRWMFTYSNKEKNNISWLPGSSFQLLPLHGNSHFPAQLVLLLVLPPSSSSSSCSSDTMVLLGHKELGENVSFPHDNGSHVYNEVLCLRLNIIPLHTIMANIQWSAHGSPFNLPWSYCTAFTCIVKPGSTYCATYLGVTANITFPAHSSDVKGGIK